MAMLGYATAVRPLGVHIFKESDRALRPDSVCACVRVCVCVSRPPADSEDLAAADH